jgi:hypothetical protein
MCNTRCGHAECATIALVLCTKLASEWFHNCTLHDRSVGKATEQHNALVVIYDGNRVVWAQVKNLLYMFVGGVTGVLLWKI